MSAPQLASFRRPLVGIVVVLALLLVSVVDNMPAARADAQVPSAPTAVVGELTAPGQVQISWQVPIEDATRLLQGFEVSLTNGDAKLVESVTDSTTSVNFNNVPAGVWNVSVIARSEVGDSEEATGDPVTVTDPSPEATPDPSPEATPDPNPEGDGADSASPTETTESPQPAETESAPVTELAATTVAPLEVPTFVSTWLTTSAGQTISLPLINGGNYNFTVDWGDGTAPQTITAWNAAEKSHRYAVAGTYTVSITGTIAGWSFGPSSTPNGTPDQIREIRDWGSLALATPSTGSLGGWFNGASDLSFTEVAASTTPDLSDVTSMSGAFKNAKRFNSPLNHWPMGNITTMASMFELTDVFNQPIGAWDTSNVVDMSSTFSRALNFDQNVGTWSIKKVRNLTSFARTTSLSPANYSQILIGWENQNPLALQTTDFSPTKYLTSAKEARDQLVRPTFSGGFGWTITDGGEILLPGAPTNLVATAGNAQATISFSPGSNGGGTISNYEYQLNGGNWTALSPADGTSPVTIVGLTNTVTYDIKLRAVNQSGAGAASAAVSVRPFSNSFTSTWQTTTANESITLPLMNGGNYNFTVDWGDGSATQQVNAWNSANRTHIYAEAGTWTIRITGTIQGWRMLYQPSSAKIREIQDWGPLELASMSTPTFDGWFGSAPDLSFTGEAATTSPGLRYARSMQAAFKESTRFNSPVNHWDMSQMYTFIETFADARAFNQPLNNWNTAKATTMNRMFVGASAFDQNLGTWNMTAVTDLQFFAARSGLTPANYGTTLIGWSTQNVKTGLVTDFSPTKYPESAQDARNALTTPTGSGGKGWTITDGGMAATVPPDAPSDLVASPGNRQVTIAFTPGADGGNWITNYAYQLDGGAWVSFDPAQANTPVTIDGLTNGQQYSIKLQAENSAGWGAESAPVVVTPTAFVSTWQTTADNDQIMLPLIEGGSYSFTVDWGDGTTPQTVTAWDAAEKSHTYATAGTYVVSISGEISGWRFQGNGSAEIIREIREWGLLALATPSTGGLGGWFAGASELSFTEAAASSSPDLSQVTSMAAAFQDASGFDSPLTAWNMANIAEMSAIFSGATSFNQDISGWDTSSVTNMAAAFQGATSFNRSLAPWNTGNVTNMENMFAGATSFNQDLGIWNMASVSNLTNFASNTGISSENYGNILVGWASQNVQTGLSTSFLPTQYPASAKSARDLLTGSVETGGKAWTIDDGGQAPPVFISTWQVGPETRPFDNSIVLPLDPSGSYNFTVDWGDGSPVETITSYWDKKFHDYSEPGTYTVRITGTIEGWRFGAGSDSALRIREIRDWGSLSLATPIMGNTGQWFANAEYLSFTGAAATTAPNISNVTSMYRAFADPENNWGPSQFNSPLQHWDMSNVTNMLAMFEGAVAFNQPIGDWNTAKVTNMANLFNNAASFNQPIGTWNTSSVQSMSMMFDGAKAFNQPVGNWDTSAVTSMFGMFRSTDAFNQPIGDWNTANVTALPYMFQNAKSFNQPIGGWNTAKVTNMAAMFSGTDAFNQPIGDWNTANVTALAGMFSYAKSFNQPIGGWNTAKVTNMAAMFNANLIFNEPINAWNVSSVTDMSNMFNNARQFDQNLGAWNITAVTNLNGFAQNSGLSTVNYGHILNGWAEQNVRTGLSTNFSPTKYPASAASARNALTTPVLSGGKGWNIIDGGPTNTNPPAAPSQLSAAAGAGQVEISFTPGADGGAPITNYEYQLDGSAWVAFNPAQTTSPVRITGLADGASYTVKLRAVNADGPGSESPAVSFATPVVAPAAPSNVVATPGNGQVVFTFTPGADGGATISNYEYQLDDDAWVAFNPVQTASPVTITGLTNGTEYSVKLRGVNAAGVGAESAAVTVTPGLPPTFISTWETTTPGESITLPLLDGGSYNFTVDWGDGSAPQTITAWNDAATTHLYASAGVYTVAITGTIAGWRFGTESGFSSSAPLIREVQSWGPLALATAGTGELGGWFRGASDLSFTADAATTAPDLTHVTSMAAAFDSATRFNSPLEHWNIANVTNMGWMFNGANTFNQPLGAWNTANVQTMQNMFADAAAFNMPLRTWTTSNVTNMSGLFNGATSFDQPLDSWDTSNVATMDSMFNRASAFNQNLSAWDMESVSDLTGFAQNAGLSTATYGLILNGWAGQNVQTDVSADFSPTKYPASAVNARNSLTTPVGEGGKGWNIVDGGLAVSTPGAPTSLVATPGNTQASIAFTSGAEGGSAITNYEFQLDDGGWVVLNPAQAASPVTIAGLINGQQYSIKLRAVNADGAGAESASVTVTPVAATVPGVPRDVASSSPGPRSLSVTWSAPADDGGSPITGYIVSVPGVAPVTLGADATGYTFTGLAAGSYTASVVAVNVVGSSAASPDTPVVPVSGTTPSVPQDVSATSPGPRSLSVTWVAPADGGGSPITGYVVSVLVDGVAVASQQVAGDATSFTFTGLAAGSYTASVVAVNVVGSSAASPDTPVVSVSGTTPSVPQDVSATSPGPRSLSVTWSAPADGGGSPITGYTVSVPGLAPVMLGAGASSYTFTGLDAGSYSGSVLASNGFGNSPAVMAASIVVPGTVPSVPQNVAGSSSAPRSLTVTWAAPTDSGGSALTGYLVSLAGQAPVSVGAGVTSYTFTGLNAGDFVATVVAVNAVGDSAGADTASVAVAGTVPSVPQNVQAASTAPRVLDVTWSAPADDGGSPITGYTISLAGQAPVSLAAGVTTYQFTGLNAGEYIATVVAVNAVGDSAGADTASIVVPGTVPSVPQEVTAASPSPRQLLVTWVPPADIGGLPLTGYMVQVTDGVNTYSANVPVVPPPGSVVGDVQAAAADPLSYTFTGMNAGDYQAAVVAVNTLGSSAPASAPAVVPVAGTVPSVPQNVAAASPSPRTLDVSWSAPADGGGSSITGYVVSVLVDGVAVASQQVAGDATSFTFTGLAAGSYTASVVAVNAVGSSAASPESPAVPVAATVPSVPRDVAASSPGPRSLAVSWSSPADNGGSPITGYIVSVPGVAPVTLGADATSFTFTGLAAGSYTASVVAVNAVGSSAASPDTPVVPVSGTTPSVPQDVSATSPGPRSLSVTWSAPADDGGSPITGYVVSVFVDGVAVASQQVAGDATSFTFTGLATGSYTASVVAVNAVGSSAASPDTPVVPVSGTAPSVPQDVSATSPAPRQVLVTWTPPSDTGGSPITGYLVQVTDGTNTYSANVPVTQPPVSVSGAVRAVAADQLSYTFTGMNAGDYQATVVALNSLGSSAPVSAPAEVPVPGTAPGSPTNVQVVLNGTEAIVSWTAPVDTGGLPITGYTVTASPGGASCITTGATTCVITGLTPGTSYTFTVVATNTTGGSSASAASAAVTPISSGGGSGSGSGAASGSTTDSSGSGLARTGAGSLAPFIVWGLLSLIMGALLLRYSRIRSQTGL